MDEYDILLHWRRDFVERHRVELRTATAIADAERLEASGRTPEQIERHVFNGLPTTAGFGTVVRAVRQLAPGRTFGRCRSGTLALLAACMVAEDRGIEAARRTFAKTRSEAHAFGRNLTRSWLAAAGWPDDELSQEDKS